MATYVYQCPAGHETTRLHLTDSPLKEHRDLPAQMACETCGKDAALSGQWNMGLTIPEHMKAGEACDILDRDREYKRSGKFYERCKQIEAEGGEVTTGSEVEAD